jgi:pimeloyl-ACP methyl ester carboxylesterase
VTHFVDDQSAPMALGAEMAALIPNARFVCLPGNGHALYETGPGSRAFGEAVARFFAEPA